MNEDISSTNSAISDDTSAGIATESLTAVHTNYQDPSRWNHFSGQATNLQRNHARHVWVPYKIGWDTRSSPVVYTRARRAQVGSNDAFSLAK